MEWIIGFVVFLVLVELVKSGFTKSSPNSRTPSPTISTSSHPNAGLIAFLDPEDCYRQGILPHKNVRPCGCVTYSDDKGAWATDCCQTCSDNSPF